MRYKKRDKLFDKEYPPSQFTFDAKVAEVFDDMVSRSVPLYKETMKAVINLSKTFVKNNSSVYDIGCSTGTLLSQCENNFKNKSVKYFGIDSSLHMLKEAKKKLKDKENIFLLQQNIENELNIKNASVIFMNYTLQFVRPIKREKVLKRIFDGMTNNSAFFLVEKTLSNCKQLNQIFIDLYHSYKLTVGYTNLEIKKKREALENVLIPFRLDENLDLLKKVGFSQTEIFFKWYNWCGIVAIKNNEV